MATNINPVQLSKVTCSRCGSRLVKACLMTYDGYSVEHVDFYCAICEAFITHLDVKPVETHERPQAKD